ncbi:MAG: S8 family serine peptidase [Oscillospiraceae bacterium]|nr:S8 family serine peptidase [Oscillospiraceae bacterium]
MNNMWLAPRGQGKRGWNFEGNNNNCEDYTGHGTHVAGTIGAVGNNFIGVTGVSWVVRLASLKIGGNVFDMAAAINAIDYANRNRIQIINSSWGSRFFSSSLKYAIDNYDGLLVVSAGNNGSNNDIMPVYPSSYDSENIISVAAADQNDNLASFSNYGEISVDIAAPGTDILSTALGSGYTYMSGTSMAAPHVAGAAALLKGYRPELTALEIKDIILSNADKKAQYLGKVLTGGTINISRMFEAVS